MRFLSLFALILGVSTAWSQNRPLIDFPTANRALLEGRPADFFMFVDRDFEGQKTTPWQGGQYGFVRGPRRVGDTVIYSSLHEGIDISPVRRDAQGNPLDDIKAAADGVVVHVNPEAGGSNYGRYIVIEHVWQGSKYYTLYAHLSSATAKIGQRVMQGEKIATMGYTGAGIDRRRSHLHFEVCLKLNDDFESWHRAHFPGQPNRHGPYNGLNLVGADPTRLLMDSQVDPTLSIGDYFAAGEPAFRLTLPNTPHLYVVRAYPWLVAPGSGGNPPAWTITFSRYGIPLKAVASPTPVAAPRLDWVADMPVAYAHATRGLITGSPGSPRLTDSGMRFARLVGGLDSPQ